MSEPIATDPDVGNAVPAQACGGCGARVEYVPGAATMRCPYCQHEQPLGLVVHRIREHDITELADKPQTTVAAYVLRCQQCGATSDTNRLATRCQFCNAPLVADTDASQQIAPEAVLAFEVDRDGVRKALRAWVASRWFAPNGFRQVSEAESLVGTYMPHWTYDADTESDYEGERGDHYWVTETYTTFVDGKSQQQTRQVMKTRWSDCSGTVARSFDDLLVRGTTRVAHESQDKLEPWPLDHAVPYQPEYLAGFSALRYDVEPEAGLQTAKTIMAPVIERDCEDDIGGDEQRVHRVDTRYSDVTYKLLLLPVWVVCYLYVGKTWRVLVNGRTGEVIGDRPYSRGKIALATLGVIAAIVGAIVWIKLAR